MKTRPVFRSEARWVSLVRQLAGAVTVAAVAVAAAAVAVTWSLGREHHTVILGPDSTAALYPVCAPGGDLRPGGELLWFPQRQVPRRPVPR